MKFEPMPKVPRLLRPMVVTEKIDGTNASVHIQVVPMSVGAHTEAMTDKTVTTVKIVDEDTEEERRYTIVGDAEADASNGRISISSPIARALIGKSKGDSLEVPAPGGTRSYEILEVQFIG